MEKGPLDNLATKDKGKAAITAIKYSVPDRAMLFSFYNHPQPLWVWVDGTSISPGTLNLHVDVGGRVKASIKRKEKQFREGGTNRLPDHGALKKENNKNMKLLERGLRTEATQDISEKSIVRHARFTLGANCYRNHDEPSSGDQGLAFQAHALQIILFGPLTCEPNTILGVITN